MERGIVSAGRDPDTGDHRRPPLELLRLACRHCRASAIPEPFPGELTTAEGEELIADLAGFGTLAPVLVLTGGDPLMRPDLLHLVGRGRLTGIVGPAGSHVWQVLFLIRVGRAGGAHPARERGGPLPRGRLSVRIHGPDGGGSLPPAGGGLATGGGGGGRPGRAVRPGGPLPLAGGRPGAGAGPSRPPPSGEERRDPGRQGDRVRRPRREGPSAGFLPVEVGNVRTESIVDIYRGHPLLRAIRRAGFSGRCGICEFRDLCGGSRARAWAAEDPLGEEPACVYVPPAIRETGGMDRVERS